jgi:hypothetical protein
VRGIHRREVLREAAHDDQPLMPPHLTAARWLARPLQCQLGGDDCRSPLLEVVDELREHATLLFELEAEGASERQVLVRGRAKRAHDFTSGQAKASGLSRSRSTRA